MSGSHILVIQHFHNTLNLTIMLYSDSLIFDTLNSNDPTQIWMSVQFEKEKMPLERKNNGNFCNSLYCVIFTKLQNLD